MGRDLLFRGIIYLFGIGTIVHAVATWPIEAVLALFVLGGAIAFLAEVTVTSLGWLQHNIGFKLFDVPVYVLFGWTAVIYGSTRFSFLVTDGWVAITLAAVLATTLDLFTDHYGVAFGFWTYLDGPRGPTMRSVPWWNFVGWFIISYVTVGLTYNFL